MKLSSVQTLHRRIKSPQVAEASDRTEEPCSICGGLSSRGIAIEAFITKSLTDQNTFRCPSSSHVCEACAFVRGRFSPVPGREPKDCERCNGKGGDCKKCEGTGKRESGGRYGNFSHIVAEVADCVSLNGLDQKWGFDGRALVARLNDAPRVVRVALELWTSDLWRCSDEEELWEREIGWLSDASRSSSPADDDANGSTD